MAVDAAARPNLCLRMKASRGRRVENTSSSAIRNKSASTSASAVSDGALSPVPKSELCVAAFNDAASATASSASSQGSPFFAVVASIDTGVRNAHTFICLSFTTLHPSLSASSSSVGSRTLISFNSRVAFFIFWMFSLTWMGSRIVLPLLPTQSMTAFLIQKNA